MSYAIFVCSLIGLCAASLAAFIAAFKRNAALLAVFVSLIALSGSAIYFSYHEVLGFPVERTWEEMPERITVIFFRVEGKENITLWIMEKGSTRLVTVPYSEPAEDGLEGERGTMGQGTPVTFVKNGEKGEGEGQPGEGRMGQGEMGEMEQPHGWKYIVESRGDSIPGGTLPPKDY